MQIEPLGGQVTIIRAGKTIPVRDVTTIKPGDEIAASGKESLAKLRLEGQRFAWVGADARVAVVDETSLDLSSGSLKASSEDGDDLTVSFEDIQASSASDGSLFRVDQGFGFARAAVYAGEIELSRPGQRSLAIPALFEATTAGGELPPGTDPYTFDDTDQWDKEHLADIIELDQDLESRAASLATQLGNSRPTLGFFGELAGRQVDFMRPYLRRQATPTGDLLIGFVVAENAPRMQLEPAFETAFQYHDDGGQWGIVASILDVQRDPLLSQLTTIVLATGVTGGEDTQSQPDLTIAAARDATGSDQPQDPGTEEPPDDPGTEEPPDDPGNEEPNNNNSGDPQDCEDGVDCADDDLNDAICGGENPPPVCTDPEPPPDPAPEDEDDEVLDPFLPGGDDSPS